MAKPQHNDQFYLVKFLLFSAFSFVIGTVHGVLQVLPPVRAWLDSIGSPYGGPGHMIDPLAHAHINLIGGVTITCIAIAYYMLPKISQQPLYSQRMAEHSFWWTAIGILGFYSTLMVFGIWEGNLLLAGLPLESAHQYYAPIISVVSIVMAIGLWLFLANVFLTIKTIYKKE